MKAVMVMYDSLRMNLLPCYGSKEVELPNFKRLAERTVVFDNSYVCSLPCIPARREIHTGRPNFLHRGWGPLEPFDDSMPEILKQHGIYSRLVTDHAHYVEDGGGTYHPRYSSWEVNRGQEGDPWQGSAEPVTQQTPFQPAYSEKVPASVKNFLYRFGWQDVINRRAYPKTDASLYPQARTFAEGLDFIQKNNQYDNWFLQIETFDPHEPFNVPDEYLKMVADPDAVSELDWPPYAPVTQDAKTVKGMRDHYLGLLKFCDANLGKVLDEFDKYDLWKDTMLIVNTDHGYLLGEHGWWAKGSMPDYCEISHTPLFIWDPRSKEAGLHRQSLVQTIDLAPTILDYFHIEIPKDMTGKPLAQTVKTDEPVRTYGIFGANGDSLNITDGHYVLMLAPKADQPNYEYTLMPTRMRARMTVEELRQAKWHEPFSFTKGCSVMQIPGQSLHHQSMPSEELLFDVAEDPNELTPIVNEEVTLRLKKALVEELEKNDAPAELYARYQLK
jgi:arylsulfatase A-like enzyme